MSDVEKNNHIAAFGEIIHQFQALNNGAAAVSNGEHRDLGAAIWLSCDPKGHARMSCHPQETSFRLSLSGGDTSAWTCIGIRLHEPLVREGRFVGLLIEAENDRLISYTPKLRYFLRNGQLHDAAAAAPSILPGGRREVLSYIPIDPNMAQQSSGYELNIYFHNDALEASIWRLEPLLIR